MAEYSTQTSSTPQVSYLTTDHLGSTRLVTDQLGAVKDRKDYGAFGDETVTAARVSALGYTTAEPTRKGYTGYEKDAESSLEFAQARYYSTTHGRYTSVDPLTASASIRNPQTFNRYTYVLNSPYKYTDPLGLAIAYQTGACSAEFASCTDGWAIPSMGSLPISPTPLQEKTDEGIVHDQQTVGSDQQRADTAGAIVPVSYGDPAIVFDNVEVYDVLDDTPVSQTKPAWNGDANRPTIVDLGYNPGASTFFVRVAVSVSGEGSIVKSVNPNNPDKFETRVEARASFDPESKTETGRRLDLAPFPGSDPPQNQKLDIWPSGKKATLTFAVKLSNDALKTNDFVVTVYGVSNQIFGPRGQINTENSFRGTIRLRFTLPRDPPKVNPFFKTPPPKYKNG